MRRRGRHGTVMSLFETSLVPTVAREPRCSPWKLSISRLSSEMYFLTEWYKNTSDQKCLIFFWVISELSVIINFLFYFCQGQCDTSYISTVLDFWILFEWFLLLNCDKLMPESIADLWIVFYKVHIKRWNLFCTGERNILSWRFYAV